ncbi:MAG: hypothetical protein HQL09_08980 [Nitrospirae bacterium]|nr:hypothetical protein [Nitrospirota bacterium]
MNKDILKKLLAIEDESRRRAYFIAILSGEMVRRGADLPIVIGGEAVELYTQGRYTTGDIDLKGRKEVLEEILAEWRFEKRGRIWVSKEYSLYVDWLGGSLDEGAEAEKRTNIIALDGENEIRVISFEDLIVDRLCAAKYWKDQDSLMWAKNLMEILGKTGGSDRQYLATQAEKAKVADLLSSILPEEGGK